jgi:hypothetical protein
MDFGGKRQRSAPQAREVSKSQLTKLLLLAHKYATVHPMFPIVKQAQMKHALDHTDSQQQASMWELEVAAHTDQAPVNPATCERIAACL